MDDRENKINNNSDDKPEISKIKEQEAAAQARVNERLAEIRKNIAATASKEETGGPDVINPVKKAADSKTQASPDSRAQQTASSAKSIPEIQDTQPRQRQTSAPNTPERAYKPAPENTYARTPARTTAPHRDTSAGSTYQDKLSPVMSDVNDEDAERQKRVKILLWAVAGVCSLVIIGVIIWIIFGDKGGEPANPSTIEEMVFSIDDAFNGSLKPYAPEDIDYPEGIQKKYKHLYATSNKFVGWLNVPGTAIDTPIYQASDNAYYIKRDFWSGAHSRYGTSFLDCVNDITPAGMNRNTVLYGHNFDDNKDNSYDDIIFGEIEQYTELDFYKKYPVIEFNTLYADHKWKVIACMHTNGHSDGDNGYIFYYIYPQMNNDNFMEFVDELAQRSYIHTGVDVEPTDKILTLSTCTYFFDTNGAIRDGRCVVIARMVRPGESEDVDVSKAVKNETVRYPQLYYTAFGGTNPYKNASKWYAAE